MERVVQEIEADDGRGVAESEHKDDEPQDVTEEVERRRRNLLKSLEQGNIGSPEKVFILHQRAHLCLGHTEMHLLDPVLYRMPLLFYPARPGL